MTQKLGSLAVSLSLDASSFNGGIAQVDRSLRSMGSELKATKALGADYGKSLEGLKTKKDILSRSVEAANIKLTETRKKYDEMVASGSASEVQMERQAKRVNDAQAQYNRLATELNQVEKAFRTQSSTWYQYGEKLESTGDKLKTVGTGMTTIGNNLSTKVSVPLAGLGVAAFKAAVDFEDAFAGVRKTVDMTETEYAKLSDEIRKMAKEIPASATEIARVAEAAGQLGIEKDSILGFTRTMVDLGVATNMTSDEAATSLARLANITEMSQSDFDRLGSSVVALGNNFATTESEIVDMALRLAGAGAQIGLSEADILALSTALSSVGIQAEMGGSAMSRVMVNMQVATSTGFTKVQDLLNKTGLSLRDLQMMASHSGKAFGNLAEDLGMTKKELTTLVNAGVDLENFAKVAGMTGEQFKKAFEEDAINAIGAFINGLANAEESGESAINMLQEMGITEIQLRDALLRSGGAAELFANAVDLSSTAWEENNALTKEAEERYKTTASQLKILWNRIKDVGISFGEVMIPLAKDAIDAISPMIDKFGELDKEQQKTILTLGAMAVAVGPVLSVTGNLTNTLGGTLSMVGSLSKGIGAAGGLVPILAGLTGPTGIAIGAIGAVGAAGYGLYKVLNQTTIPEIDIFGDKVSENTKQAVGGFIELANEATIQLNQLAWSSQTVTQEIADKMISTFDEMGNQVLAAMEEDHTAQLETVTQHLSNVKSLSKQEQDEILASVVEGHKNREEKVNELQKQYNQIIEKAVKERRDFSESEKTTLANIQQEISETAIKYLSETEREQKVILERIKSESDKINAEQAIEVAKRAKEAKDAVIAEAEQTYDEQIKTYIMLRDETKDISQEKYESLVKDAEDTRDETIAAANGQYDEVLRIAKEKGGEYVTETELQLGRAMTHWEKLVTYVGLNASKLSLLVITDIKDMSINAGKWFLQLKSSGVESAKKLYSGYKLSIEKIPSTVKTMLINAVTEAAKTYIDFYNTGKDTIQGLIDGIGSMKNAVVEKVKTLAESLPTWVKKVLGIKSPSRVMMALGKHTGEGLAVGIDSTKATNEKAINGLAKVITSATKKNAEEVAKIAEEAEKKRTQIQKDYAKKRAELAKTTASSSIKNRRDVSSKILKLNEEEQKKLDKINEQAWNNIQKREAQVNKARLEAIKLYVQDKKTQEELSHYAEAEIWRKSLAVFNEGTKERVEIQKNYQAALKVINDEVTKTNEDYAGKMTTINDKLREEEKKLTDEYEKTLEDRTKALINFSNTFDFFEVKLDKSSEDLMANLKSQVFAFERWQQEIDAISKKAIDKGLIDELKAMGPKALPELIMLNNMTDKQLTEYSDLYSKKSQLARQQAEKELIGMKSDTEKRITDLRTTAGKELETLRAEWVNKIQQISHGTSSELGTLPTSMKSIGNDAIRGLMEGLRQLEGPLMRQAREIGDAVAATLRKSLQVKSPSRVTMQIGEHVGEGLMVGMENMLNDIKRVAARMGEFAIPTMPNMTMGTVSGGGYSSTGAQSVSAGTTVHQEVNIYSPKALSPAETARLNKRAAQELAMAWR